MYLQFQLSKTTVWNIEPSLHITYTQSLKADCSIPPSVKSSARGLQQVHSDLWPPSNPLGNKEKSRSSHKPMFGINNNSLASTRSHLRGEITLQNTPMNNSGKFADAGLVFRATRGPAEVESPMPAAASRPAVTGRPQSAVDDFLRANGLPPPGI
ncbi:hypothetical protein EVAR_31475_1 [Eumeta japonica]|uniref:Uncharacterized protein n=1 Tax=Eumeta variegata TaxID=151549 RepID=A0A4C1WCU0_EUMVA|nr:hypothetical protein EVAR_31475_1 [Eumeta japonica]